MQFTTWLSTKPEGKDEPCDEYRLPTTEEWQAAALYSTHGQVTWEAAVADTVYASDNEAGRSHHPIPNTASGSFHPSVGGVDLYFAHHVH